ncbi:MAG: AraC family transcriptional regulator [Proteobacteria bacterium]|nr:AraC family transcriptional regulator [Pseudomonadota bacterium]
MEGRKVDKLSMPVHDFKMPFTELIPFEISSFEQMPDEAKANFPHRHNFYEILYITQGEGQHIIDFQTYPIQPHTLYFISPRQIHFWQISTSLQGWLIFFTDEFLLHTPSDSSLLSEFASFHSGQFPFLKLEEDQTQAILPLINNLVCEYLTHKAECASILRAYLHIFLVKTRLLYNICNLQGDSKISPELVRRFKRLVIEQRGTQRSVKSLAEQLYITEGHLCETVKSATGCTPGQIIRQTLTLEAKRLLANTDLTVYEIAYSLSFEDPFYFGRLFKRETGMSPYHFRQSIREKYRIFQN